MPLVFPSEAFFYRFIKNDLWPNFCCYSSSRSSRRSSIVITQMACITPINIKPNRHHVHLLLAPRYKYSEINPIKEHKNTIIPLHKSILRSLR